MRNQVQAESQRPASTMSRPVAPVWRRQPILIAATLVCAASMLILGVWAFSAPESFSRFIDYAPYNQHLIHDAGAFQIGTGAALLLALVCPDALLVALTGFTVARARFAGVIGMQTHLSPGWRRIAAFGLDYGFIFAYLRLLTLVGMLGRIVVALPTDIATPADRMVAQLVIFALLTVPITVWFARWEATPGGATPGTGSTRRSGTH